MRVIVNADDFGYSRGVNLGILEAFKKGIVTSTSMMTNMPGFDNAIELMKKNSDLKVGIHLVMTVGKPLASNVKTIVNEKGYFDRNIERIENGDINEIRREYRAQINKFLESGFKPTHIDFHYAGLMKQYIVAMEFAKELNIPIRAMTKDYEKLLDENGVKHSYNFNDNFYDKNISVQSLIKILEDNKEIDIIELMCHPAYIDSCLLENSTYNTNRAYELQTLTSEFVKGYIKKNRIELINFTDI